MATLKVNGTEIYYEQHGSMNAPAVVLSTPVFLNSTFFLPIAEHLKEDFRVILYDHRGHGKSAPLTKRPDIESTAQDAIKLIEHLKLDQCHFVGNGLGAHVGLHLSVRKPELLKSAILMGALPEGEPLQRVKELDQFIEALKHDGMKTGVQSLMHSYFGESFLTSDDPEASEMRERITEHLLHLTPHEMDNIKQVYHRPAISADQLKRISTYVTIAVGTEDLPDRNTAYRRLAELINHSSYQVIPDVGYLMALEKPAEIAQLISERILKSEAVFNAAFAKNKRTDASKPHRF